MSAMWWVAVAVGVLCLVRAAWVGILALGAAWKQHRARINADIALMQAMPSRMDNRNA